MFTHFIQRLRGKVFTKQLFVSENVALFSSDTGNQFNTKNRPNFFRRPRRRSNSYIGDAGIRHNVRIMQEESTPKGSRNLMEDPEEYDIEENEYDEQILKSGQVYDEMKKEEATRHNLMINKIIERKYFKPPREPNLLTYAAKQQVKYLNEMDPKTWTPEKLAESFPISLTGVKKLLKSKLYALSEERIAKHDKVVRKHWDQTKDRGLNEGPISSAIDKKLKNYQENNPSLPLPSKEWQLARMPINSLVPSRPPGEFENLLQIGAKREKENVTALPFSNLLVSDDREGKLLTRPKRLHRNESVSIDEFKRNLKQHVSENIDAKQFDRWFSRNDSQRSLPESESEISQPKSPYDDIIDYFNGNVQKYNQISTPNLKWDVHKGVSDENDKEAYIYDAKHGYQKPYGSYYNKESPRTEEDDYENENLSKK